jgi:hypothetical protein
MSVLIKNQKIIDQKENAANQDNARSTTKKKLKRQKN